MISILKEPHSIRDGINLLFKALKYKRFSNGLNIYRSFKKSAKTGIVNIIGSPISVSFEPTTSCNLRCPQCPSGLRSFSRETGMLDVALYDKFIQDNYQTLLYLLLYFQGEPYLHKKFFDLVKLASDKHIYTATSTNAHYLDTNNSEQTVTSGLDRLIISIDGLSDETYKKYRIGGSLEKVIEGTKNLVAAKKKLKSKTPFIIWQFIVFKHNEHEVEEVKKLGKQLGVNQVAIKTAQVYDEIGAEELLPTNPLYRRYEEGSLILKTDSNNNSLKNECWKMWHSCVITWDGFVVPCCFDKDAEFKIGSLKNDSLQTIWNSNQYKAFRETLWKGRKNIPICNNCSEGTKVWEF